MLGFAEQCGREAIETPALSCLQPLPATGQHQALIAHPADPVLRLPASPPLDAEARPDRVVHAQAEQVPSRRRLYRRSVDGPAKQQTEGRAARTKVLLEGERQIDLQARPEQEGPVGRHDGGRRPWF
ncbi:MAG TPA: hypothetical protein VI122_01670 [Thermoleophilaceae bacterium]